MNKAFTLIELLAVLAILAILALAVSFTANRIFSDSKKSLYCTQVSSVEEAAKKWSTENIGKLPSSGTYTLSLQELANSGYIESKYIKNPKSGGNLKGNINITYNQSTNQYNYKYQYTKDGYNNNYCKES